RTIEVLDQRGIAERFLSEGQVAQVAGFAGTRFDSSGFPTRHPYGLALLQHRFERILAGWVGELGVPIHRGRDVTGFVQDATGVDVQLSGRAALRARYLVGCDGGRSVVRKAAGIDFPGWEPTTSTLIAEVQLTEEPKWGVHDNALGRHAFAARALRNTVAQVSPLRPNEHIKTLGDIIAELLTLEEPRRPFAAMTSGLDIHYDPGEGHPLLGRRMPDLDLVAADGPVRVFALLHDAKPVLLNFGKPGELDITPWADRVQRLDAKHAGDWELPDLGP